MSDASIRKSLRRYFGGFPGWTINAILFGFLIGAASVCLLVFRPQLTKLVPEIERHFDIRVTLVAVAAVAFGVLLVGLAVLRIIFDFLTNPSDRQVDKWLQADLDDMVARGMEKLNLEESDLVSDHYVTVRGPLSPEWDGEFRGAYLRGKEGADHYYRYTIYEFLIIYFTKDHISVYKCIWYFLDGKVLLDETHEFFYRSVVSVSTVQMQGKETDKAKKGSSKLSDWTQFRLVTTAGTWVGTTIATAEFIRDGDPWVSEAEKTTKSVRKMLREKNSGS